MSERITATVRRWLHAAKHDPLTWPYAILLAILVPTLAFAITHPARPYVAPPRFAIGPTGEEVARLAPLRVTFVRAPLQQDAEQMIRMEPPVAGAFAWLNERTLLFQPDYPGYERGREYTVHVAPQPEAALPQGYVHRFTTTGALRVVQVVPADDNVDVPDGAHILVQFSRGVAPLTVLAEATRQQQRPVLEFDPPLPGRGEWVGTALYRYTPTTLPASTEYRVRVVPDLSAASDGQLPEAYEWTFRSYSPAVVTTTPDTNTEFGAPNQPVTLEFNVPMDRAAVERGFVLREAGQSVPGSFAWSNDDRTMTFQPAALKLNTTYEFELPAGVRARGAGETQATRVVSFKTVGPPTVSSEPRDGAVANQYSGARLLFSNPMAQDSLEGRVFINGVAPADLRVSWSPTGREAYLYPNAPWAPSAEHTVRVAAGVTDRYGQALAPFQFRFTTPPRPAQVQLAVPGTFGTYSSAQDQVLYFHAVNTPSVEFTLYPLTAAEAQGIAAEGYARGTFRPSQPSLRTWQVPVAQRLDQVVTASTPLAASGRLPRGHYYLASTGATGPAGGPQRDSQWVFSVVDTALVMKTSQDDLLVWAVDLESGAPVGNLELEVIGPVVGPRTARTDMQGVARFRVPPLVSYSNDIRRQVVVTSDTGRHGIAAHGWATSPSMPSEPYVRPHVGHLYTDRPIYRPGEEMHLKGVVRVDDDARYSIPAPTAAFTLVIVGPQNRELMRTNVTVNEFGTFGASFPLPENVPVGEYRAMLTAQDAPAQSPYGTTAMASFAVIEFRRAEFEVSVSADAQKAAGDPIAATVSGTFLFGGVMSGAPVKWEVVSTPRIIRGFGQYAAYSFNDFDQAQQSLFSQPLRGRGTGVLGPDGRLNLDIPTDLQANQGSQTFTISATVTDENGQALSSSAAVRVLRGEITPGVRPANFLATAGQPASALFVAMDGEGRLVPNRAMTISTYRREWVTTKEQASDGSRFYRSEPVDTLIERFDVRTNADGEGSVQFTPARAGSLRIVAEATDDRGRTARSAAYLYVGGAERVSWQVRSDDNIALITDRDRYEVGDTAEILVPAPFTGAIGLVTIERGKTISHRVQRFETDSERLRIPIDDHAVPNIFVSVVLYRPPTAEDPVPRYKVGYARLSVSTADRVLNVTITPDRERAAPREQVRYALKVTDHTGRGVRAELSVAVVDKGVLLLAEERGPTGLGAFWFERGLGVRTASSLTVSVDRSNDTIRGLGDNGQGKGGDGLADGTRKEFKNTAFWAAQVVTNDRGEATVEVPLPDNLTTWRLQARAVSGDTKVGEAVHELLSTKPVLARPALPRFVRVGDALRLRVLVRNGTTTALQATAALAVEGFTVAEPAPRQVMLAPDASTIVDWPATVGSGGPTARATFTVTAPGGLNDAVELTIPIREAFTPETMATGGVVEDEAALEAVYLAAYAVVEGGRLELSVQPSLSSAIEGELRWFRREPIEGTDYVAARLIATLGVRANALTGAASSHDPAIRSDIANLLARARADGGWGPCAVLCGSDPETTGNALIALGEARAIGFETSTETLEAGRRYLRADLARVADVANPADPNRRAMQLYAIAHSGDAGPEAPQMRALFEQYRRALNNSGRAYLIMALREAGVRDRIATTLLNDLTVAAERSANGSHWEDPATGYRQTTLMTTALAIEALTRVSPRHLHLNESVRWLVANRTPDAPARGLERARSMHALAAFAAVSGEADSPFDYSVRLNGEAVIEGRFGSRGAEPAHREVPLADLKLGAVNVLEFARQSERAGRMYFRAHLRYLLPAHDAEAVNRGFGVAREYALADAPDRPITGARIGDTVRVRVTVVVPADRGKVEVADLLPAGLEPIDPRLKIASGPTLRQLEEERRALNQRTPTYTAPWARGYASPWTSVQLRDDQLVLAATKLPAGVHEYVYLARATTPGTFFVPPATASEADFPDNFGRSDARTFVVLAE